MRILLNLLLLGTLCFPSFLLASIGKVSLLKGNSVAVRANQTLSLSNGMDIEKKDTIKTAKETQIQLIFEDKTVITLGSESEFSIEEYLNDTKNPKAKFKFNQGTFKSITGQIGKTAPENFILETKTATIGIRGTIVLGNLSETGDSIGCLRGLIAVSALGSQNSILVPMGKMTFVAPGKEPTPPATMKAGDTGGASESSQPLASNAPPPPPNAAMAAASSSTQDSITKNVTAFVNNTNSFYPTFSPSLALPSTHIGLVQLDGFASSWYTDAGTSTLSTEDTFTLLMDTTNNSINTGSELLLKKGALEDVTQSLYKSSSPRTMTYTDINNFAIQDFKETRLSWMQTENTKLNVYGSNPAEVSANNDYISWGYWAIKVKNNPEDLLSTTNFWVGGTDASTAATYITNIVAPTSYTFSGKALGTVNDNGTYAIDPINDSTNNVRLSFDFGGGSNALNSNSFIQFTANEKYWSLVPTIATPTVTTGIFNDTLTGSASSLGAATGTLNGQFYGTSAQAVGGTFQATAGSASAYGIFKAVRP